MVYGSPSSAVHTELQDLLQDIGVGMEGQWLLIGDFNFFLHLSNKKGGRLVSLKQCRDFVDYVDECGLIELETTRSQFTWSGQGILEKLDWGLCNIEWKSKFPKSFVGNLLATKSDHSPLMLQFSPTTQQATNRQSIFRYQTAWLLDPRFASFLSNNWNVNNDFHEELCCMTPKLQEWNKSLFGGIVARKERL